MELANLLALGYGKKSMDAFDEIFSKKRDEGNEKVKSVTKSFDGICSKVDEMLNIVPTENK